LAARFWNYPACCTQDGLGARCELLPGQQMKLNRNQLLLALLAPVAFTLGTWGFLQAEEKYTLGTAMLAAVQLFTLNSGLVDGPIPWPLECGRWLALLFSGSALLSLFRRLAGDFFLRTSLFLQRTPVGLFYRRRLCVVVGLGRKGMSLLDDLRAPGRERYRVLAIDVNAERVAMARSRGVDGLVMDGTVEENLRLLPWGRMQWLVLLMGGNEPNLTAALSALRVRGGEAAGIAVQVPSLSLRNLIHRQNALKVRGVHLFNYHERLARQTLLKYPMEALRLQSPRGIELGWHEPFLGVQGVDTAQEQVPHVFLRPSGEFTQALVCLLARSAHYPLTARRRWTRIRVVVVDAESEQERATLQRLHPALRRSGEGALLDLETLVPAPGESPAQAIAGRVRALPAGTPATVFLDIHHPAKALIEALTLLDELGITGTTAAGAAPVAADLRCIFDFAEEPGIQDFIRAHASFGHHLLPLPSLTDCCGAATLFDAEERLDGLARSVHAQYDPQGKNPWDQLTHELQESNRAAADHIGLVLRHLGKSRPELLDPNLDWGSLDLDALAECEHRRWAAQKLMDGWVPDPSLGEDQDKKRKRHGCLDRIYESLSEAMKERDRANVRHIPVLLRQLEVGARKAKD